MNISELGPGITIFTPTFNRAHTLCRLYNSLKIQNCDGIEWLIVDDGSTDQTRKLIEEFILENKIQIRYVHKENGGKHTALNMGIQLASKQYFCCVDSDDCLIDGAIEIIRDVVDNEKPNGIIAYKSEWHSKERIGDEFPQNLSRSTLFDLINVHLCNGDRTLIFRTDLIRKIKIPEPEGVSFFPETYLYDRFDERYVCTLVRENLCACEYLEGGYSDSFRLLMIRNALSMKWFYAQRIDMPSSFWTKFCSAFRYIAYMLLARSKEGRYCGKNKYLLLLAAPVGLLMYIVYMYYRIKDMRG